MALRANTTINWDPLQKAKEMPVRIAEIIRTVGNMWKFGMMPNHFERYSAFKYGYAQRTLGYIRRRAKHPPGYGRELMWSGALFRSAATGQMGVRAFGGKAYAKLLFRGGFTNKRTGRNVRQDLFSTVASERERLGRLLKAAIYEFLWEGTPPKRLDQMRQAN